MAGYGARSRSFPLSSLFRDVSIVPMARSLGESTERVLRELFWRGRGIARGVKRKDIGSHARFILGERMFRIGRDRTTIRLWFVSWFCDVGSGMQKLTNCRAEKNRSNAFNLQNLVGSWPRVRGQLAANLASLHIFDAERTKPTPGLPGARMRNTQALASCVQTCTVLAWVSTTFPLSIATI
jgi:hypothetical protein